MPHYDPLNLLKWINLSGENDPVKLTPKRCFPDTLDYEPVDYNKENGGRVIAVCYSNKSSLYFFIFFILTFYPYTFYHLSFSFHILPLHFHLLLYLHLNMHLRLHLHLHSHLHSPCIWTWLPFFNCSWIIISFLFIWLIIWPPLISVVGLSTLLPFVFFSFYYLLLTIYNFLSSV